MVFPGWRIRIVPFHLTLTRENKWNGTYFSDIYISRLNFMMNQQRRLTANEMMRAMMKPI